MIGLLMNQNKREGTYNKQCMYHEEIGQYTRRRYVLAETKILGAF